MVAGRHIRVVIECQYVECRLCNRCETWSLCDLQATRGQQQCSRRAIAFADACDPYVIAVGQLGPYQPTDVRLQEHGVRALSCVTN